jgi:glycosyltransferase involved in cell wall biosynthesis
LRDGRGRAEVLRDLGLVEGTKVVVIIGSITPRKGLLLFVQAARCLSEVYGKVAFVVVGDGQGPYVEEVKASVRESHLGPYFHFLGWRADVAHILRGADVLVVASEQEAFGRTVVEAMGAGVPVVSTRCGGPEEIVVHGETGFLIPNKNSAAMAQAIASLLGDPEMALRLGAAGRARAVSNFSIQAYAGSIQVILSQVARPDGAMARGR